MACAVAVIGMISAAPAALAHEGGEGETQEGYLLVQQALGYLAGGGDSVDAALEKIDDTLATSDQDGVDIGLVVRAQGALESGDVTQGQTLLQESIAEAVSDLPPAVGLETGTTVIPSDLPGRGPLSGLDWAVLGLSVLLLAVGAWLAVRLRPADTVRALQAQLSGVQNADVDEQAAGMEQA